MEQNTHKRELKLANNYYNFKSRFVLTPKTDMMEYCDMADRRLCDRICLRRRDDCPQNWQNIITY